jgi:3-oxoadipate enol-lactonase
MPGSGCFNRSVVPQPDFEDLSMYDSRTAARGNALVEARLLHTVKALRHLAANLPGPIRICFFEGGPEFRPVTLSSGVVETQRLVTAAFACVGVSGLRYLHGCESRLSSFEMLISRRLSAALDYRYDHFDAPGSAQRMAAQIEDFDFRAAAAGAEHVAIPREAGVWLSAYGSAQRTLPPVVLALPCGMPLDLCLNWFNTLSEHHFVVTWETRGLFGTCNAFDHASSDIDAQVSDLIAVMDRFELERAQVMGICGGATIALCAAVKHSERVSSLSLWYGDYNLADDSLRTRHQQHHAWLMESVAQDRAMATDLQRMFTDQATLVTVPAQIAHAALYPYANAELMYRYARLNDALNKAGMLGRLPKVAVPTLVVTGDADETTHRGGSEFVGQRIAGARLEVEAGGSHPMFFSMPAASKELALEFFASNPEYENT